MRSIEILNRTRSTAPSIPFEALKNAALGKQFTISLVFAGDTLTRRLNHIYRKKRYVPNVLSFAVGKNDGEIFINLRKARAEARSYDTTYQNHVAHLFIHGCLHLKGLRHGVTMESIERRLLRRFGFGIA